MTRTTTAAATPRPGGAATGAPVLEVREVSKRYGAHLALAPTSLTVAAGESVAVIGENGAGKSTLAKILTGALRSDGGQLLVDGRAVELRSPRAALEHGIALIPQELAVVPELTAAENIRIGRWPGRFGITSVAAARRAAERTMEELGLEVDLGARMADLKLADRQVVEILKALVRGSRLIILDEPTASLSASESAHLFSVLEGLCAQGLGMVFISHHLDEVRAHAERVDVFRNGERVFTGLAARTTNAQLIELMLGHEPPAAPAASAAGDHPPGLVLRNWSQPGPPPLRGVDLTVGAGEVVALFGVRGSGAEAIGEALGGRNPRLSGTLEIGGRVVPLPRNPRLARRSGIAYVPPERKVEGLVLGLSVEENVALPTLGRLSRFGVVGRARRRALAERHIAGMSIRTRGPRQPVGDLSGGNQQKVLLASRLAMEPRVFVLQEPTRGVDVGSRDEIHRLLRALAADGATVLVVTSDVEEAVLASDRLVVIRDGAIAAQLTGTEKTRAAALGAAAGEENDDDQTA